MRKLLLLIVLIAAMVDASGQYAYPCVDSLRTPDPFYQCRDDVYDPVCGCDNITYRNACAAENWGGLINNGFAKGWTDQTVCGNFDFDITPNAITFYPAKFSLFSKIPGSATLYIYNRFGGLEAAEFLTVAVAGGIVYRELDLQSLEIGVYLAIVVVNNEKQYRKIAKVLNTAN